MNTVIIFPLAAFLSSQLFLPAQTATNLAMHKAVLFDAVKHLKSVAGHDTAWEIAWELEQHRRGMLPKTNTFSAFVHPTGFFLREEVDRAGVGNLLKANRFETLCGAFDRTAFHTLDNKVLLISTLPTNFNSITRTEQMARIPGVVLRGAIETYRGISFGAFDSPPSHWRQSAENGLIAEGLFGMKRTTAQFDATRDGLTYRARLAIDVKPGRADWSLKFSFHEALHSYQFPILVEIAHSDKTPEDTTRIRYRFVRQQSVSELDLGKKLDEAIRRETFRVVGVTNSTVTDLKTGRSFQVKRNEPNQTKEKVRPFYFGGIFLLTLSSFGLWSRLKTKSPEII